MLTNDKNRWPRISAILSLLAIALLATACATSHDAALGTRAIQSVQVVTPDQVTYQPLNPARGDAAPQAGVLWGDISKDVPSGMLLRFADGFSSPPHIHNITYRAVVISGQMHNDDPKAAKLWMGPGSYWMQPAGEDHITAAKAGGPGMAFLEILEGPYLVQPSDMAFDNGERPINQLDSNIVWLGQDAMNWIQSDRQPNVNDGPMAAMLWGSTTSGELSGSFIKLPAGFSGRLSSVGHSLRSVVIQGQLDHQVSGATEKATLGPGGYFAADADIAHELDCHSRSHCLVYIRTAGRFNVE